MRELKSHFEELRAIKRHAYHPLLHKLHKEHNISRKTLLYIKEYGPHSNVIKTILKESIKILVFASIISSFGGLAIEYSKTIFVSIIPLIILLPTLNDMIGDYGTIVSSKLSTMLHEGKINENWLVNNEIKKLFTQIFVVALLIAFLSTGISFAISKALNYNLEFSSALKILLIVAIDVILLVSILFAISVIAGLHFYNKKLDPNNFLIPIATSIADIVNMIVLSVLVILVF